ATWFASQDGDGPWERVTASSSGAFNFAFGTGRGGIAMVTPGAGLFLVYATSDELKANLPACNGSVRTVTGSVSGFTVEDNVSISMGSSNDVAFGPDGTPQ